MIALSNVAEDPCIRLPAKPGTCRICGCTEARACIAIPVREGVFSPCWWVDETRTLCSNPVCLEAAAATGGEPS